ncbi:zinc transporter 2-like [Amphibalanus amphitrite]|uniref:zinc transporter 2-like n=2 Tax=Amphibalanus amphitrite TaxID=1232801 RepID=UPI001C91EE65|nr:zinc transporter 2-like [Amphibalanus amphitrite]
MDSEKGALLGSSKRKDYGSGAFGNGSLGDREIFVPPIEPDSGSGCWPCCWKPTSYRQILDHVPEDHCHRQRESGVNRKATKQLLIATSLCFCFMLIEAIGGYISNSIAVLTDAAHLCTDLFAFIVSLSALFVAARPPSSRMSFGWRRAEVMGALISVLLIWIITAILVDMAVDRLLNPDYEINAPVMVGTSVAGIIINIIMGCALNQDAAGSEENVNINVRAAFIHVLGDLIQSIGVCIAAIIIYMRPDWIIADPICTFIFSVIVFSTTIGVLKDALRVLLAATPPELNLHDISAALLDVPGVVGLHGLRVWALSMDTNAVMVHLEIKYYEDGAAALEKATDVLRNKFHFYEICVQVDTFTNSMNHCTICNENKEVTTRPGTVTV